MASYEPKTITLSRQTILLITLVGIGILTMCYVFGVHVGRQSATTSDIATGGTGEDLRQLPAAIQDQIKAIDDGQDVRDVVEPQKSMQPPIVVNDTKIITDNKVSAPIKTSVVPSSKPELRGIEKKIVDPARWTTQLVSTPDLTEAQRVMGKVQAAGFSAVIVSERGLFKVRLSKSGSREAVDATMVKLKNRGFKPFAIMIG